MKMLSTNVLLTTAQHKQGFTLMELLIAVAIVGILATIAYPNYLDHIYKTRRSDGQTALMNVASYLEAYYTQNNSYTDATLTGMGLTANSPQNYYTISISSLTTMSYTITAAPVAGSQQAGDSCGTLTLTNTNVKGPSISCWQ